MIFDKVKKFNANNVRKEDVPVIVETNREKRIKELQNKGIDIYSYNFYIKIINELDDEEFKLIVDNYKLHKSDFEEAIILKQEVLNSFENGNQIIKVKSFVFFGENCIKNAIREEILLVDKLGFVLATADLNNAGCVQENGYILNEVRLKRNQDSYSIKTKPIYGCALSSNENIQNKIHMGEQIGTRCIFVDKKTGQIEKKLDDFFVEEVKTDNEKLYKGRKLGRRVKCSYYFDYNGNPLRFDYNGNPLKDLEVASINENEFFELVDKPHLNNQSNFNGKPLENGIDFFKFSSKDFFNKVNGRLQLNNRVIDDLCPNKNFNEPKFYSVYDKNIKAYLLMELIREIGVERLYNADFECKKQIFTDAYGNELKLITKEQKQEINQAKAESEKEI